MSQEGTRIRGRDCFPRPGMSPGRTHILPYISSAGHEGTSEVVLGSRGRAAACSNPDLRVKTIPQTPLVLWLSSPHLGSSDVLSKEGNPLYRGFPVLDPLLGLLTLDPGSVLWHCCSYLHVGGQQSRSEKQSNSS